MGTDNRAEFILSLEGDGSGITALFNAFKKNLRSDVSELERITGDVVLFKNLKGNLDTASAAVTATTTNLAKLKDQVVQVQSAGESVGKDLALGLKDAERAANAANKEFEKQSKAVDKLGSSLTAAGVDLKNLAAAEARLAVETKAAAAAAVEQQSKAALSFRTMRDIAPEVNRLTAAYTHLRDSGKLSFGELSILQARYQQSVTALRGEVVGLGAAFSQVRGGLLAVGAAFAGIIAGSLKSAENFREFSTQIAAVGTIAGVSDKQLAELGAGVRKLSREMGTDAVDSAKALYNIIGSGISPDNSLAVLAEASKAARAGLTDVHTAASIGVAILNGYQLRVDSLAHVYDVLFQTVKDGVVTFPELAKNLGQVIPIARAANVTIEELGAAFIVLTRQGIDAPEAATAIGKAIQDLAAPAPEAAAEMRALGISFDGLVGSIGQLSSKNLSLDQINRFIPDVRAQRAVLALSNNFELLRDSVLSVTNSAGSMEAAYARMAATPQAKVDRFNSSIKDLSLSVGEFVTNSAGFVETLTSIANAFNTMGEKAKSTTLSMIAIAGALAGGLVVVRLLAVPLNLLAGALLSLGPASVATATGLTAVTAAVGLLQVGIAGFLGFKLGEILFEWSAAVRFFGTGLGLIAATIDNLARFSMNAFIAAITLNVAALKESYEQFRANNRIIAEEWGNAISGGTEKTRQLTEAQNKLGTQLATTAKAAAGAATELDAAVSALLSKLDAQAKAVQTALTSTQAKLTSLVASLAKAVTDTTAAAQSAISNLAANTATKLAALSSIDAQKVRETVEIQRAAAVERLLILAQFAVEAVKAFDQEAAARRAIAIKSGEDIKKVDQDLALLKKGTLTDIVNAYRTHVDALLALEQQHLANVRTLEEQRAGITQSVDEKIRLLRQGGLNDYQKFNDNLREIDRLTAAARQALATGDIKAVEQFAQKAIDLSSSIGTAVTKDGAVVVSQFSAQETAVSKITAAEKLLLEANTLRTQAERAGATAAADGLKVALPLLEQYKTQLAAVTATAKEGIKLKIGADVKAVTDAVDELEKQLKERKITLELIAGVKEANDAIQKVKDDLAKGIPVELTAKTEALDAAIQAVRDAKPELNVETAAALGKVDALRAAVQALDKIKVESAHVITSNVDQVTRDFKALDGQRVTSFQDIVVTRTEAKAAGGLVGRGFARGGPVGSTLRIGGVFAPMAAAVQHFARGGAVFRKPSWMKVPGQGSGDTVPAALRAGSFVVRKSASSYYGDGIMGRLARGFGVRGYAGGGTVTKQEVADWAKNTFGFNPFGAATPGTLGDPNALQGLFGSKDPFGLGSTPGKNQGSGTSAPVTDPKKGFQTGDTFQDDPAKRPPISFDTRPIPEILITAANVLAYAREMLNAVGRENPLLGVLLPQIEGGIKAVESNPTNLDALKKLLQAAETIGSNFYLFDMWGKTAASRGNFTPTWFIDWLQDRGAVGADGKVNSNGTQIEVSEFAKQFFGLGITPDFLKRFFGDNQNKNVKRRFSAAGGPTGGDTINAMLTPGEHIIREPAAKRYGTDFLNALNAMQIPRSMLAGMLQPPMPRYFAEGGPVGFEHGGGVTAPGIPAGGIVINNYFDASDIMLDAAIDKRVMPKFERALIKAGVLPR